MKQRVKQTVLDVGRHVVSARQARPPSIDLSWWGLEINVNGQLERRGVVIADVVERFGSPVHVVDATLLEHNIEEARSDPRSSDNVFFSYKTNPVPGVLERIHAGGIGAEVISEFELWLAIELGVVGDRLIYNGPAKSDGSLRTAITHGALVINANTVGEIDRISAAANEVGRQASVGLRIALPRSWSDQFGVPSSSPQLVDGLRRALADPMLDLRGLHFHRGIQLRHVADVKDYIDQVLAFCDHLYAEIRWVPAILDMGGNLTTPTSGPITSRELRLNRAFGRDLTPPDPETCVRIGEAVSLMQSEADAWTSQRGLPPMRVIVEPGRALTGGTQLLLTRVLDINDGPSIPHAVLDAGINVAEPTSSEFHQLISVSAPTADIHGPYRLVGPICTVADVLYNSWRLPELTPGHVLAVMDSGAYFVPFSTSFSFPKPPIVIQQGSSVELLRGAESFTDMVRLDDIRREGDRSDAASSNAAAGDA